MLRPLLKNEITNTNGRDEALPDAQPESGDGVAWAGGALQVVGAGSAGGEHDEEERDEDEWRRVSWWSPELNTDEVGKRLHDGGTANRERPDLGRAGYEKACGQQL